MANDRLNDLRNYAMVKILGVGGGGGNAVSHMASAGLSELEFAAVDTNETVISRPLIGQRLQIGVGLAAGKGTDCRPEISEKAAKESRGDIAALIKDVDMLFVIAGMGGGAGTGVAPVIAQMAKDRGILTVGIVTRPFLFEGKLRTDQAEKGITELRKCVDVLITISDEKLLEAVDKNTAIAEAFRMIDAILLQSVEGVIELVTTVSRPADFADIYAMMKDSGETLVGVGQAGGETRVEQATRTALSGLLPETPINEVKKILGCITGDMTLRWTEVTQVINLIEEAVGLHTEVELWGLDLDEELSDTLRVTIVASGFEQDKHKNT